MARQQWSQNIAKGLYEYYDPENKRIDIGKIWGQRGNILPYISPGAVIGDRFYGTNISGSNPDVKPKLPAAGFGSSIRGVVSGARSAMNPSGRERSSQQASSVPTAQDLARYNDLQISSKYRPTINELTRQMEAANAMGMQADRAIGGWGKAAGQEISSAGRRNFGEVQGIQRNLGGMLAGIGAASGNLGTVANNQSFVRGAAGGAGLIAGLGAADQGWFNRARDVNAQTTNFYRNNARDQFAQQAADLLARRNDQLAAMREAQAAGAIKAKTDAYALNQNQTSPQDQADLLTSAVVGAMNAIKGGTSVAEARRIAVDSAADPELQRRIYSRISSSYAGPRGSTGWKNTQRLRQQGKKEEGN